MMAVDRMGTTGTLMLTVERNAKMPTNGAYPRRHARCCRASRIPLAVARLVVKTWISRMNWVQWAGHRPERG